MSWAEVVCRAVGCVAYLSLLQIVLRAFVAKHGGR